MDLYDDDDAEFFDVPDLNSRTWRHPSEVAAGLAATAPDPPPAEPDEPTSRQPHLVGAVVAAAMCTMGLVFGGVLQPGTMLKTQAKQVQIDPSLGLAADETYNAAQTTLRPSSITDSNGSGLFSGSGNERTFVARYIILDGVVLTSASAIEGRENLVFRIQDESEAIGEQRIEDIPVQVIRTSPENDVAVLDLPDNVRESLPSWSSQPSTDTTNDPEGIVTVADCTYQPVDGTIRFTDVTSASANGVWLDGLVETSIPAIDCAPGGPVTNSDGELVGMAANTAGPQTLFIPQTDLSTELTEASATPG